MKAAETVATLVKKPVEDMGFELYDVEYIKEQGNWVLTVYIDKQGGVDINDCERVSRALEPILDEADPIEQAYYLSVSSVGIDRPIKKDRDFQRNIGNEVTVRLYVPLDKKKEFRGVLTSFDADGFTIIEKNAKNGVPRRFLRKDAASIKPYIEF